MCAKDSPFAQLSGRWVGGLPLAHATCPQLPPNPNPAPLTSCSDNIIAFTTQRYQRQPLIVRGPGAGAEVTAGGVFSDLLRLAAYLGAPS